MPNQYDNASGAKPQGRTRKDSVMIALRLTRAEDRALRAAAAKLGVSRSEYLRTHGLPHKPP